MVDPTTGFVTIEWQQWLQNPQVRSIVLGQVIGVASGGTGLAAGTTGGVLAFTGSTTLESTAAGTTTQLLHGSPTGALTWAAVSLANDVTGTLSTANVGFGALTNSISGDVSLNDTGLYFDGPIVAQGTTGKWFASGTVTLTDTAGAANMYAKLWDGTTVIASGVQRVSAANQFAHIALSGYIANPQGDIRISVRDVSSTSGAILADQTGNGKDSTISAFRIG